MAIERIHLNEFLTFSSYLENFREERRLGDIGTDSQ